jgi:maltose O-acetyltransferase
VALSTLNENGEMEQEVRGTRNTHAGEMPKATEHSTHVATSDVMNGVASGPSRVPKLGAIIASEVGNLHLRLRVVNAILVFCPPMCFSRVRTQLYRLCGVSIGHGSLMIGNITLSGGGSICDRLRIGRHCVLNAPLYLDLNAAISIGDEVSIGHHVILITTEHEIGPAHYRCGHMTHRPITIGNGCWIGARATILPGVTVGDGSIVSAGAVVFQDVPPNKMVAGNPARPVKSLD